MFWLKENYKWGIGISTLRLDNKKGFSRKSKLGFHPIT
jgi:hypothetical protein